jgi:hypothetical protein
MYYNKEFKYLLFDIPIIQEKQELLITQTANAVHRFKVNNQYLIQSNPLPDNITWYFQKYNIFNLCACHQEFYNIYKGLVGGIKEYYKQTETLIPNQLWLQSWVNSHTPDQVLRSHDHDWPIHGYISIDPKESDTVFTESRNGAELFRIRNRPGQVYIGVGKRFHHVEMLSPFDGQRITIGFDLEHRERIFDNLGFFPVML